MSRLPGPRRLPARVYWRRRLVLLTLVLALAYGIAQLFGGGSGDPARPVGAVSKPHGSEGTPSTAPTQPTASGTTQPTPTPTKTPLAVPTGRCADDDVQVKPVVDPVQPGVPVVITLDLTTKDSPACTWQVSPSSVVLQVTSGSSQVWSTQDCRSKMPEKSVVLRRDHHVKVSVTWGGRRSDGTCGESAGWALPGYYHAEAAALGAEPQDVGFRLAGNTPPTVTAHPKPRRPASSGPTAPTPSGSASGTPSASPSSSASPGNQPTKTG